MSGPASGWYFIIDNIRHTLSEYLYEKTRRRLMVMAVMMEV